MVCALSFALDVAHGALALYAEMREGLLSDASEYGSKPLTDHLKRRSACYLFLYPRVIRLHRFGRQG